MTYYCLGCDAPLHDQAAHYCPDCMGDSAADLSGGLTAEIILAVMAGLPPACTVTRAKKTYDRYGRVTGSYPVAITLAPPVTVDGVEFGARRNWVESPSDPVGAHWVPTDPQIAALVGVR